jgi:hypothetical protein
MSKRTGVWNLVRLGAVAALALTACDDDKKNTGDTAGGDIAADSAGDTSADSTTNPDGTTGPDGSPDSTTNPDGTTGPDTVVLPQCTTNAECTAVDAGPCRRATCDTAKGQCRLGDLPDGTPCSGDACKTGQTCSAGACAGGSAAPDVCAGRECGLDECGNSCGTCAAGASCGTDGLCVAAECGDVTEPGCCTADGTLKYCENGALMTLACASNGTKCGWDAPNGYYDCAVDQSAGDPSGASPYLCPGEACVDACKDRECGFDCGTSCGTCEAGEVCSAEGVCGACTCDGKTCGDDGCGNSCGTCGAAELCENNQCVGDPCLGLTYEGCCTADGGLRWCEDGALQGGTCPADAATCGWAADGGFYDCGQSPAADPSGTFPRACPDIPNACGDKTEIGCCDGNNLLYCDGGEPASIACEDSCGWDPTGGSDGAGWYDCGFTGADPSGANPLTCATEVPDGEDPEVVADGPPETVELAPDVVEDTAPDVDAAADAEVGPDVDAAADAEVGPDVDAAADSVEDAEVASDIQDAQADVAPTPIQPGACTNEQDYPLWYATSPEDKFFACIDSEGPENTAAVEACMVTATGLGTGCVACYGAALECGTTSCSVCLTKGLDDPECEACFADICLTALSSCTGI